jgi:hypothetical protein
MTVWVGHSCPTRAFCGMANWHIQTDVGIARRLSELCGSEVLSLHPRLLSLEEWQQPLMQPFYGLEQIGQPLRL